VEHPEVVREFVREEEVTDLGKLLEYGRVKQGIVLASFVVRPVVSCLIAALLILAAHKVLDVYRYVDSLSLQLIA